MTKKKTSFLDKSEISQFLLTIGFIYVWHDLLEIPYNIINTVYRGVLLIYYLVRIEVTNFYVHVKAQ